MARRNRGLSIWMLVVLGIVAGVVVMLLQQRPAPAADAALTPAAAVPTVAPPAAGAVIPTLPESARIPTSVAEPDLPADATLFIPASGIFVPMVQVYLDGVSWDIRSLGKNAGHLQGTPLPDEGGNTVLSGHVEMADGSAGPFAGLKQTKVGDVIEVTIQGQTWRYSVTEIITTTPDALQYVFPTDDDRLTLITCGDYDFLSNAYPDRLVVIATRIT